MKDRGRMQLIDTELDHQLLDLSVDVYKKTGKRVSRREASKGVAQYLREKNELPEISRFLVDSRANVNNLADSAVMLFSFALAIILMYMILMGLQNSNTVINEGFPGQLLTKATNSYAGLWDNIFVMALVFLMIATLIISYVYRIWSWWFFFSVLLLAIYYLAVFNPLSYAFYNFRTQTEIASFAAHFPKMIFIFNNYETIFMSFAILVIILNHLSPAENQGMGTGGLTQL